MSQRGKCPKCGGELVFPENMERIICMYCGKSVNADELIQITFSEEDRKQIEELEHRLSMEEAPEERERLIQELLELDSNNHQANLAYALDNMHRLYTRHRDILNYFKEETYEEAFEKYLAEEREVLDHLELACYQHEEELPQILRQAAKKLIDAISDSMEKESGMKQKLRRNVVRDDYKMTQVVFIIPMIRELRLEISEEFADHIIDEWVTRYPNEMYYKGDYHKLIEGFRKRKICYITTAVCETFGKSDRCYELMRFRQFRDDYLLKQENGEELVQEYYSIAPAIVASIDMMPERADVYEGIWNEYLKPCLSQIENGENEACRDNYIRMVRDLEQKYYS
ncbi:CFI-box-CTERM domain-containing protein [Anaerolentibacter hominis]|uniref:CFI-box-CTERM domain-containing protein n=1 Tax=Anaerolentibacter hominis TaxID=3079009 RepID=UPI0031B849CB